MENKNNILIDEDPWIACQGSELEASRVWANKGPLERVSDQGELHSFRC